MKSILIAFLIIAGSATIYGQKNLERQFYEKLLSSPQTDTSAAEAIYDSWQKTDPKNIQLYVAQFNLILYKNVKSGIEAGRAPGQSSATIHNQYYFEDPEQAYKAIDLLKKALTVNPRRLDIVMGMIYTYSVLLDADKLALEAKNALKFGKSINNQWTYRDTMSQKESTGDLSERLWGSLNDYLPIVMEINIKAYTEATKLWLDLYPDVIYAYDHYSRALLLEKNYEEALRVIQAEDKKFPNDGVILLNLAETYTQSGDKANAIKVLDRIISMNLEKLSDEAQRRKDDIEAAEG